MLRRVVARAVLLTSTLLVSCPATGAPTIDLSWDQCSPIVSARTPTADPVTTLYVSATGLDFTHRAYAVVLWFATDMPCRASTFAPDAWRFDAAGCQGSATALVQMLPSAASKSCPAASPSGRVFSASLEQVTDPQPAPPNEPLGAMRVEAVAFYPAQTPDPAQRYLLLAVLFDHTFSVDGPGTPGVTCGGYETPMCFALYKGVVFTVQGSCGMILGGLGTRSSLVRASDQAEIPFELGQGYATFGLPAGSGMTCFEVVPAERATWGGIKSQYR